MKATVKESHTFKPITVELVIESPVELAWLKAVSNMSIPTVKPEHAYNGDLLNPFSDSEIGKAQMSFFKEMDKL